MTPELRIRALRCAIAQFRHAQSRQEAIFALCWLKQAYGATPPQWRVRDLLRAAQGLVRMAEMQDEATQMLARRSRGSSPGWS